MKQKKVKWICLFLLLICLSAMRAQKILNVKEKSGMQTSFNLSDIKKMSFSAGNMTVNKKGGSSVDFALINVRNMNFENTTSIDEINSAGNSNMTLYPNPVKDRLQVRYETSNEENVLIQLIDIQGKLVYTQNSRSQLGINYVNINAESFQNGIYLFKLQTGNRVEINKFIKY